MSIRSVRLADRSPDVLAVISVPARGVRGDVTD